MIGGRNTFLGEDAGTENIDGSSNTFLGNGAGRNATTPEFCVAVGKEALQNAVANYYTIAVKHKAGFNDISTTDLPDNAGIYIGHAAGYNGGSGIAIAIGDSALYKHSDFWKHCHWQNSVKKSNVIGYFNVGVGFTSLENNTIGINNTKVGTFSLIDNTTGDYNVAVGYAALDDNVTGHRNTALGYRSGPQIAFTNLSNTTALGADAIVTTSNTMVFGDGAVDRWAFGTTTTKAQRALQVGDDATNGNGAYLTKGGS